MVGGDERAYNAAMAPVVMGSGREMHGTTRAQRRPRPAPDAASPARRSRARRSEGRGALAVDALRGRRHAGRTRRSRAAGRRRPRPCLRALGREGVSRRTRGRRDPARGARRRGGEGRRPRDHARRRPARVAERATRPSVRPCGRRCLRAGGTRTSSPSSTAGTSGRPRWRGAGTGDHRRAGHARCGPGRVRRLRRPQVALDPRPFPQGRLARRGGGPPRRTRRRRVRRPAAGGARSRPRPGRRRERDLGQAGPAYDLGVGAGAAPPVLHRADPRPLPFARALVEPASSHHERVDGSGYHRSLSAEALSRGDRILAAADVFAALTADRPHRPAFADADAARTLEAEAGAGSTRTPSPACSPPPASGRPPRRRGGRPTSPTGRWRCCA